MPGKFRPQCSLFLENADGKILLQLRDEKEGLAYPGRLGTFGGQIEEGESKEEAMIREIAEEIEGYKLFDFEYIGNFPFDGYDVHFFYKKDPLFKIEDYKITEGQGGVFVDEKEMGKHLFAFNAGDVLKEFFKTKEDVHKGISRIDGSKINKKNNSREELTNSNKGYGITFIDLDETLFKTFAKINIKKNGKIIKSLSNKEFNSYILGDGEIFDFSEFQDAKIFKDTSIPIPRTINMVKQMLSKIKEHKSFSRIVVLTARQDFWDKDTFLQTFSNLGIDVTNKDLFYIDRAGNIKEGSIAEKKRTKIISYLKTGKYRRCRLIDDDAANLETFMDLAKTLSEEIKEKVRKEYNIKEKNPIKFFALQIQEDGKLKKF